MELPFLEYEEFKKIYKELTKREQAIYEYDYGYMSKIFEEHFIKSAEETRNKLIARQNKILHDKEVDKILNSKRKINECSKL